MAYQLSEWRCKDCGGETGSHSARCPACEEVHREKQKTRWDKRKADPGLCPRCGKRPVLPGAKSCLECGLGVKVKVKVKDQDQDQEYVDYVSAAWRGAVGAPLTRTWQGLRRLTKKWLGD